MASDARPAAMTTEQAVLALRADPAQADLVRDSYFDEDPREAARRYEASEEFAEIRRFLAGRIAGARILDIGAGRGLASHAFARAGASEVTALEPDPSPVVGKGALERACEGLPVKIVGGWGESLPFPDGAFDVAFARQVFHHARDLPAFLRECARVLRPGGVLLACREHVVDDEHQLAIFLSRHAVHQLAGGEHAYPLAAYVAAIRGAGLVLERVLDPWDCVTNAFPAVRTAAELAAAPVAVLRRKVGPLAPALIGVPAVARWARARLRRPVAGRMYSFLAVKPASAPR